MQKPCCFSPGRNKDIRTECENICVLFPFILQTFHTPSLGDEEFEIPPITPPPESDPALGIPDVLLPFQGLSDPLPSQGSEFTPQFPPQSLDLPSITISRNVVEQDGVLHSSGSHMVGSKLIAWTFFFNPLCFSWRSSKIHVLSSGGTRGLFFLPPCEHRYQINLWYWQEGTGLVDRHRGKRVFPQDLSVLKGCFKSQVHGFGSRPSSSGLGLAERWT